ncbi:sulfite exporter TauE/SafE family protein [Congregibacter variabilis]|uniref:Probable membrane transporter protein n=1 Tax=Congregibacter variabilis TaxID=3081200 RepID=A0ABZ0HYI7_9GAMM|nr:sulfite exporter TauE/SafE family protein [Congregibacter sp. IMCC43200]
MDVELWQLALLMGAGTIAGALNVIAGGGSLMTVPIMLFLGLSGPEANGTNRISIIAQNIVAVRTFFRRGFSEFRLSLTLSAAAIPGAILGAMVGVQLDGEWFDRVLAVVMIGVLVLMQLPSKQHDTGGLPLTRKRLILGHVLMFGAGCWGGFIQVGVGFILMPILHRVMGLDLVRTNMHKVFIALTYNLFAIVVFAAAVSIHWQFGLALAAGNALGGYFGARFSVHGGEAWIRRIVTIVLLIFIAKLLLP